MSSLFLKNKKKKNSYEKNFNSERKSQFEHSIEVK
jgi:hypothetical protein